MNSAHPNNQNSGHEIGRADEYKVLRDELQVAKTYVFERPLLIIAIGVAGFRVGEFEYFPIFPLIVAALLLYNFWFTANRLMSAARIVAYIQLELEERSHGRWAGWETCLREYRIWISKDNKNIIEKRCQDIEDKLKKTKALDALMFYPPIYWLHTGFMSATLVVAVVLLVFKTSWVSAFSAALVLVLCVRFTEYMQRFRLDKIQKMIERNRIIWEFVFAQMQKEGKKQTGTRSHIAQYTAFRYPKITSRLSCKALRWLSFRCPIVVCGA